MKYFYSRSSLSVTGVLVLTGAVFLLPAEVFAYQFTRTLQLGSVGEDVREVQKILNANTQTAIEGDQEGSAGKETTYFGQKTRNAVVQYQQLYASEILTPLGLSAGTGIVGIATQQHMSRLSPGSNTQVTQPTTSSAFVPTAPGSSSSRDSDNARYVDFLKNGGIEAILQSVRSAGGSAVDGNTAIVNSVAPASVSAGETLAIFGFFLPNDLQATLFKQNIPVTVGADRTRGTLVVPKDAKGVTSVVFTSPSVPVSQNTLTVEVASSETVQPTISNSPTKMVFGTTVRIEGEGFDTKNKNTVLTPFATFEVVASSSKTLSFTLPSYTDLTGEKSVGNEKIDGFILIQNNFGASNIVEGIEFVVE